MKYSDIIIALGNKFENKLNKLAQSTGEVSSEYVTLSVRPTVGSVLQKLDFVNNLNKLVTNLVNKGSRGFVSANSFITNATQSGGKWKLNPTISGLQLKGSLLNDPKAASAIKAYITKVNQSLFSALESDFDRLSKGGTFQGTLINNNDTDVQGVTDLGAE